MVGQGHGRKDGTVRYLAGLSLFSALILAAPVAQAFTMQNQDGSSSSAPKSSAGSTQRNYGGTLTTPGVGYSTGDAGTSAPSASSSDAAGQKPGFSFHTGPASNSSNLRPPAWSMDPLYRERGQ